VTTPANGCSAISTDLTGRIALIDRGACSFTTKVRNAETAGAVGAIVANNVAGDPSAMGHDGTTPLLLDAYPEATPAEVKSRLASNAARVVTDEATGSTDPGVLVRGGGRLDVPASLDATSWFDPVSASFGLVRGNRPFGESRTITVNGTAATAAEVTFTSPPPAGLSISATLAGDTVNLDASVDRTVPNGDYQGDVLITTTDGGGYLVPFFVRPLAPI
jgi:hypothetical protein